MARFYGSAQGGRGMVKRLGGVKTGMSTTCASWDGAARCRAYVKDGIDWVRVTLGKWRSAGVSPDVVLYEGPIGQHTPRPGLAEDLSALLDAGDTLELRRGPLGSIEIELVESGRRLGNGAACDASDLAGGVRQLCIDMKVKHEGS